MTTFLKWLNSPFILGALLVFGAFVDLILLGRANDLSKSEWAGWVQAIGSIAALAVAIFVMSRQNTHSAKLVADADKRALLRRAAAVSALVHRAARQMDSVRTAIQTARDSDEVATLRSTASASLRVLAEMREAMALVPTYDLGSYEMAAAVHKMVEALALHMKAVEQWENHASTVTRSDVAKSVKLLQDVATKTYRQFEDGAAALKAAQ